MLRSMVSLTRLGYQADAHAGGDLLEEPLNKSRNSTVLRYLHFQVHESNPHGH